MIRKAGEALGAIAGFGVMTLFFGRSPNAIRVIIFLVIAACIIA